MEVNTIDLQKEIRHLGQLLKKWEDIQLNLYYQLNRVTEDWQDMNSIQFADKIQTEKNSIEEIVHQTKDLKSLYQYLYNSYSKFGQKITCDIESGRKIATNIDMYYNRLKKIHRQFDNIDMSFSYREKSDIIDMKNKIELQLNKLEQIKEKNLSFIDKVEEIEKEVSVHVSKFQEFFVNDFDFIL